MNVCGIYDPETSSDLQLASQEVTPPQNSLRRSLEKNESPLQHLDDDYCYRPQLPFITSR